MGEEEKTKRKEEEDSRRLDMEGKEDEMEIGGNCKRRGEERKESLDRIRKNQNRRTVVEMG